MQYSSILDIQYTPYLAHTHAHAQNEGDIHVLLSKADRSVTQSRKKVISYALECGDATSASEIKSDQQNTERTKEGRCTEIPNLLSVRAYVTKPNHWTKYSVPNKRFIFSNQQLE